MVFLRMLVMKILVSKLVVGVTSLEIGWLSVTKMSPKFFPGVAGSWSSFDVLPPILNWFYLMLYTFTITKVETVEP